MDLGAGTGSMFRFLAPIIGRGQDWMLVDADAALLDDAFGRTAAWARRQGFAATSSGDELLVSTPRGLWRMQTQQSDLANDVLQQQLLRSPSPCGRGWGEGATPGHCTSPLPTTPSRKGRGSAIAMRVDAIVCSALLDLVSARGWSACSTNLPSRSSLASRWMVAMHGCHIIRPMHACARHSGAISSATRVSAPRSAPPRQRSHYARSQRAGS